MAGQDSEFDAITEGTTTILFPKGNQVFYNPVQEFNRDLRWAFMLYGVMRSWEISNVFCSFSIAVIKHYAELYWKPNSFCKKKGRFMIINFAKIVSINAHCNIVNGHNLSTKAPFVLLH